MNKISFYLIDPLIEFASNSLLKIFIFVALINLISTVIYNHVVWNDTIYLNEMGMNESDPIFIQGSNGRSHINYFIDLFSPIWLYIKLGLASLLIYSTAYFFKIDISIKDLLKNNLVAYLFVIFGDIIYSVLLIFYKNPTYKADILNFFPLSMLSFISDDSKWIQFYYIFNRINVFQVFFTVSLFLLFRKINGLSINYSLILTFSYVFYYGLFLMIWLFMSYYYM
jgi:hypothetical protein